MELVPSPRSMSYAPGARLGHTQPRLWTPPLVELTPDTSYGFDVIDFARDVLETPLDPWQEWLVIHAGELLPDGRPRFQTVLAVVARQNGKTFLLQVLSLYWMAVERVPFILGTSTKRETAYEAWKGAVDIALSNPYLANDFNAKSVTRKNGGEELASNYGPRYRIAAANDSGGRGLSIDRLILDELRHHKNHDAWNASAYATLARPGAQIWGITNQGDDRSVVLDELRDSALGYITRGEGDPRLGLFEWSAPDGSDVLDVSALAMANPNLGGPRNTVESLLGFARQKKAAGGAALATFKTEALCMRVRLLNPAIDPDMWIACGTDDPIDLAAHPEKVVLCLDVAKGMPHATLVAAALIDGLVHVDVVEQWEGDNFSKRLREDLPGLVEAVKPRKVGWFPNGPAAGIAAEMTERAGWPPRGVEVAEIRGELVQACMGLAELVSTGDLRHARSPMLTEHINSAEKLKRGDAFVYARTDISPIDGAYAAAGAAHLARTLDPPRPRLVAVG